MTIGQWRSATLAEVARWGSGGTPSAGNSRYYGGDIPWAVIGDLNDGLVSTTARTITEEGLASSSAKWVPQGAVLVAMYGSIGKLGIAAAPLTTNQAIAFAVPGPNLDNKFLFYYLMSQRRLLGAEGKGATQRNISQSILKPWPIRLPSLREQRRIVEILEEHLSHLDAATDYASAALARTSSLREELIRRTVTGADLTTPRSGCDLTDAGTQDGELPSLPEGWNWRRLGDVAEVVGGVTKDSKKQSLPGMVEVPYLRVANVQRGALKLDEVSSIRVTPQQAQALELRTGDVLLNEGGDRDKLARGWVWEGEVPSCIHQNHVFRARLRIDLDPYFLSFTANTLGGRWGLFELDRARVPCVVTG